MSRRAVIFTLAIIVIIGGVSFYAADMWIAPGHATPGHRTIAGDCFACHLPFRGTPATRCTSCHAFDRAASVKANGKIQPGNALHALHREFSRIDCANCHVGHLTHGAKNATPCFDHTMMRTETRRACSTCHRPPQDSLHPSLGSQCAECHATGTWTPATFDHRKFFSIEPPHDAACSTCHRSTDFKRYSCMNCHAHSPARIARKHAEEGIRNLNHCVRCHRGGDTHDGGRETDEHDD